MCFGWYSSYHRPIRFQSSRSHTVRSVSESARAPLPAPRAPRSRSRTARPACLPRHRSAAPASIPSLCTSRSSQAPSRRSPKTVIAPPCRRQASRAIRLHTRAYGRTPSSASCLLWESCGSLFCFFRRLLGQEGENPRSRSSLSPELRSRSYNGVPGRLLARVGRRHARQLLLDHLGELAHLFFHLDHFLAHIQNNFDAGQVHAHVPRQRQDHFEPFQIRIGVESRIALRARWLQQPHALIQAQRLRMQLVQLRDGADHVPRLGPFFRSCRHDRSAYAWFLILLSVPANSRNSQSG